MAVGEYGTILRTTMGGVTWIEEDPPVDAELPNRFALQQNYPNPFNPSTTIQFALPQSEHVTLTVHDVLGREVAVLIDGKCAAGTYNALWDAHGQASGVYFYRLSGGSYVQAKKMLLLR
jgi:hypothetical protein